MNTQEKEIEKKFRELVESHGGLCLKWVCPGWAGVPDRIVLLPGGCVLFAELKRPKGGRFSALQLWWIKRLQALGFQCWIIKDNLDLWDFKEFLEMRRYRR